MQPAPQDICSVVFPNLPPAVNLCDVLVPDPNSHLRAPCIATQNCPITPNALFAAGVPLFAGVRSALEQADVRTPMRAVVRQSILYGTLPWVVVFLVLGIVLVAEGRLSARGFFLFLVVGGIAAVVALRIQGDEIEQSIDTNASTLATTLTSAISAGLSSAAGGAACRYISASANATLRCPPTTSPPPDAAAFSIQQLPTDIWDPLDPSVW